VTRRICSNCQQWQSLDRGLTRRSLPYFDCVNGCARRGFAPRVLAPVARRIAPCAAAKHLRLIAIMWADLAKNRRFCDFPRTDLPFGFLPPGNADQPEICALCWRCWSLS
jgi:hypothetical protein